MQLYYNKINIAYLKRFSVCMVLYFQVKGYGYEAIKLIIMDIAT